ncbi:MAG TPA: response regulator [Thermoanaerobaculia bacterium]
MREVVVVEDDPGMREALQRVLSAGGFCVSTFASAEALLSAGLPPETGCCVFDVRLPGASGLELYRTLAARGVAGPTIFVTAFDDPSVRDEACRLGAAAFLIKPFGGRELVEAVIAVVGVNAAS